MVQIPYDKLTKENVVIALSIGDGCIYMQKNARNAYLDISHSKAQYDYLLWKNDILIHSGFNSRVTRSDKKCNNKYFETYRIKTKTDKIITNIYSNLYVNRKKNMDFILKHMSPFLLAIWYMDDGSKKIKKKIKRKDNSYLLFENGYIDAYMIATNGFSFEECNKLCQYLKDNFYIIGHVQSDRGTPRVSISDNFSKQQFKNIIAPYVKKIPSMEYKINGILTFKEAMLIDKISGN